MESIFRRHEEKYLVTEEKSAALRGMVAQHMAPDRFGEYLVQNVYYDTDDWSVVRASIEKPLYKEKLRLRCYGTPRREGLAYLELKKKWKGTVYKRRVALPLAALSEGSLQGLLSQDPSQISHELAFYLASHKVHGKAYIAYTRAAFTGAGDDGLRVTFDTDLRFRLDRLDFRCPGDGLPLLPQGTLLMEVKTEKGIPLWLAHGLSAGKVFPTRFSKYGTCYTDYILKQTRGDGDRKDGVGQCSTSLPVA